MSIHEIEMINDMVDRKMRINISFVILSIGLGLLFITGIVIFTITNISEVLTSYYIFTNTLYGILATIYGIILLNIVRAIKKLGIQERNKDSTVP